MTEYEFDKLVDDARRVEMTSGQKEKQRRSFAYGNANIENEHVTKDVVKEAAKQLAPPPQSTKR